MPRPECAVKGCTNGGFVMYSDKWICGECMIKIIQKETERKNKQIEELGNVT